MAASKRTQWVAERLLDEPIIDKHSSVSIGANIQGPSVIRCPPWIADPLGNFYLYFADHKGSYIRLAYADDLQGPWTVHEPGSLHLADSRFPVDPPVIDHRMLEIGKRRSSAGTSRILHSMEKEMSAPHIASPDVHVDARRQRIVMYFHGLESFGYQASRVGVSDDGIQFKVEPQIISKTYLRVFRYEGNLFGLAMPGQLYRAKDNFADFEEGPMLFNPNMRHCAVLVRDHTLFVFWTQVGDIPERIYVSEIDLSVPFQNWNESEPVEVIRPELNWEGAREPLEPSVRSVAYGRVNQLRDPAIFDDGDDVYLLYAGGGESAIGIAKLNEEEIS